MSVYDNPMSPISYTNKDFQTIYPELLEAAKSLAKNWDPTISNESDPGVILLKLNAIIADKNNYNIDKNILENYPETYTQDMSARSQYKQLGYRMPWYRAATVDVSFKYVAANEQEEIQSGSTLLIPAYCSVSDVDGQYVYTVLEDIVFEPENADLIVTKKAIQGVKVDFSINGEQRITLANIDSMNRIYIDDRNIAENGILIKPFDSISMSTWDRVDNVETQPYGSECFEFDIDPISDTPYIQFPNYIRNIIGSGLSISYIVTDGEQGRIIANTLTKLENTSTGTLGNTEQSSNITLTDDNIKIQNASSSNGGFDPESVEDAYYSFKKTIHSFDTLVTLRDYVNAVYNSDIISNSIVSDRTCDVNSHFKIVEKSPDSLTGYVDIVTDIASNEYYKKNADDEYIPISIPTMTAFDLRLYLLGNSKSIIDLNSYEKSFDLDISNRTMEEVTSYIADQKCIQHDYAKLPVDVPVILYNMYPISVKIVPAFKLSPSQENAVRLSIQQKLISMLNCRESEFGKEPSYEDILTAITNADERIKFVILDDFEYTTYAMYIDSTSDVTDVYTPLGKGEVKIIPVSDFDSGSIGVKTFDTLDELTTYISDNKTTKLLYYCEDDEKFYKNNNGNAVEYSDKLKAFRNLIITKNILSGVTPLFEKASVFDTNVLMNIDSNFTGEVSELDTNLKLNLPTSTDYTLRKNETLVFTGPSLINEHTSGMYARYLLSPNFRGITDSGKIAVNKDETYELDKNEWIRIFERDQGESDTPYKCSYYGPKTIIKPSFSLYTLDQDEGFDEVTSDSYPYITTIDSSDSTFNFIRDELLGPYSMSGTRQLSICKINQKQLTSEKDRYYYVISNSKNDDGTKYELKLKYEGSTDKVYRYTKVLDSDEFFIYTNNTQTGYEVLGEGTLIEYREKIEDNEPKTDVTLSNDIIPVTDIELNGISAFKDSLQTLSGTNKIVISEQQIFSFTENDKVKFEPKDNNTESNILLSSDTTTLISGYDVWYTLPSGESSSLPIFKLSDPYYQWRCKASLIISMDNDTPMQILENYTQTKTLENGTEEQIIVSSQQLKSFNNPEITWNESNDVNSGELYILSDIPIDKIGNTATDVTYMDLLGNRKNPNILSYKLNEHNTDNNSISIDPTSGNVTISFDPSSKSCDIAVALAAGRYLLPIVYNYPYALKLFYGDTLELLSSDDYILQGGNELYLNAYSSNTQTEIKCIPSKDITDPEHESKDGIHYFILDNTDNQIKNLIFMVDDLNQDITYILNPLINIKSRKEYFEKYGLEEDDIISKIVEIDKNNVYKYDYFPDSSIEILDPLDPKSLFIEEHAYNKVSMARAVIHTPYASYKTLNNR